MASKSNKALFIISSPFQAICAIEAVYEYKVDSPIFVILQGQLQKVNSTTSKILDKSGFAKKYELVYQSFIKLIKQTPKDLKKLGLNKEEYSLIFLGNFFSPMQRVFSTYCCKNPKETKFIYLDDGGSTVKAFSGGLNTIRFQNFNAFFKTSISQLLFLMKGITPNEFFSIFSIESKSYSITPNSLSNLKGKIKKNEPSNIYILGSNLLNMGLVSNVEYVKYLKIIIKNIRNNYPDDKIYYCPHRGESRSFLQKIESYFNLEFFKPDYTVEFDFVLNNIHPGAIYSFGSTASYSLKKLYPNTHSYTIIPETSNKVINRTYKEIGKIYQKQNIISL